MKWLPNRLLEHDLPPPNGLIPCNKVLDVGAGVRPMAWYKPERHICVEPYPVYAKMLREAGYEVVQDTALGALQGLSAEAIYLLDVLEHMDRNVGEAVLSCAVKAAQRQVVVYTPLGFLEQHGDAWGLGGDIWQEHRSGWVPEDFPGWHTEPHGKGFFAVFTREAPVSHGQD